MILGDIIHKAKNLSAQTTGVFLKAGDICQKTDAERNPRLRYRDVYVYRCFNFLPYSKVVYSM